MTACRRTVAPAAIHAKAAVVHERVIQRLDELARRIGEIGVIRTQDLGAMPFGDCRQMLDLAAPGSGFLAVSEEDEPPSGEGEGFPDPGGVFGVPRFQLGGDAAAHLLSLLATLVTIGLIISWFDERGERESGWIAAALFSAPIVVQLATTGYVEMLMTMFVTAGFYAFVRWRRSDRTGCLVAWGILAGSAASGEFLRSYGLGPVFPGALVPGEFGPRYQIVDWFALAAAARATPAWACRRFLAPPVRVPRPTLVRLNRDRAEGNRQT